MNVDDGGQNPGVRCGLYEYQHRYWELGRGPGSLEEEEMGFTFIIMAVDSGTN